LAAEVKVIVLETPPPGASLAALKAARREGLKLVLTGTITPQKMTVPFFVPAIGDAEIGAVARCMKSGWLTTGALCAQFEREFAASIGPGLTAIAVSSATAGLHLALEALGIGPGDEVIVPTLTFAASAEVVHAVGADVRFVDVDPTTLNVTVSAIKAAAGPKTKAVIVVHFAGLPCRLDEIIPFCEANGIAVVEDCAHCFPGDLHGIPIGSWPTAAAVFSFYANKSLTTGEGGMIVTHSKSIADRCRMMRLHGIYRGEFNDQDAGRPTWDYDVASPGFKYNLPDIAAAIGIEQLKRAEDLREQRARIAALYSEMLGDLPVRIAPQSKTAKHGWHLFVIELLREVKLSRADVIMLLAEAGISASMHYRPLHQMSYWRHRYALRDSEFPAASSYYERCLSLPLFATMTDQQVTYVVETLSAIVKG
jgi:dTDP-4-amino-4,6-dideoxygalactose transaminase